MGEINNLLGWHYFLMKQLPGESPQTDKPSGLQSTGLQRVRHKWSDLAHTHAFWNKGNVQ